MKNIQNYKMHCLVAGKTNAPTNLQLKCILKKKKQKLAKIPRTTHALMEYLDIMKMK